MSRAPVACLVLGLVIAACSLPQLPAGPGTSTPPGGTTVPDIFDTAWEDRTLYTAGLVSAEQPVLNELRSASVYHLDFRIAEDLYHISGTEEVRYTNAEEISLDEVRLRLFPNILGGEMTVSNITVDGESATAKYELRNSLLIVPFASPLPPGQSTIIHMEFAVTVPRFVELNYGVLAFLNEVLTAAHTYPMIAVYDDEGWNAEVPPQSGDVTYADASFFLVKVTAPKNVTVVTSGHLVSSGEAGDVQMLSIASGPARDFYLAASPNYEMLTQTFGEVTIRSYAPPKYQKGAQLALDVAARAIEDFSARYAPFPYTEFDIVSTPTLALGIEYPGMIAITSSIYDVDQDYRGTPARVYLESTVAHEVGHQWFYNLVGDDQLDDPWLDESLTQFATLQYYADEYGPGGEQGFRQSLEARWDSVGRAEIPIGLPVASYSGQEYSAIVYGRGPLFFVALRERMGTESFDAFLQEYTQSLSWGIATPEVLQSLAEKQCSCNLEDLFKDWVLP